MVSDLQTSFHFIMSSGKQLCVLLPILLVTVVIVNEALAVDNYYQLKQLVKNHFVPDFQQGGLVEHGRTQFAVVALLPDTKWMNFRYTPSQNKKGQKPLIDPDSSLSPPDANKAGYNNYLAARPNTDGKHSEEQILKRLNNLYNEYKGKHDRQPPQALLLYSWIVPCMHCTNDLVTKLTSEPFKSIPTKVVAFTTLGTTTACKCNVTYTRNKFKNTGVEVAWIDMREEEIENLIARFILE